MELFGTDGVRGIPGQFPLVPDFVARLGEAAAREIRGNNGAAGPVLFARDTRGSGPSLMKALAAGLTRAGCSPLVDLGVVPTPGLARIVAERRAAFGVVLSASHNPPEFNGIKFFDHQGAKLDPAVERRIEKKLEGKSSPSRSREGAGGRVAPDGAAAKEYLDFLLSTFPADLDLSGMRIVADAANGAAAKLVGPLLERLGAKVTLIGDKPNGKNINMGFGALAPERMCKGVKKNRASCGFALDGDADRVLFADEHGTLVNGDVLIGMAAAHLKERGTLGKPKVVVTVMSNAGLESFFTAQGIETVRVSVGDRNVSVAMEKEDLRVGGENSGHVIFSRFAPSGDGMLTALQILAILKRTGRPLSWYRKAIPTFPQVLRNVPARRKIPLDQSPALRAAVARSKKALAGGRVLLRYSGTEPLLRILVEGPEDAVVRRVVNDLEAICRKELNDHAD